MIRGGMVGGLYGKGGGNNPVAYYYGKDQTKRVGENYTPTGTGGIRLAEFKMIADEAYDGGKNDILTIVNGSDVSDLDIIDAGDSILSFPVGRYSLLFQGYSESNYQISFRVELRKIQSGTDDIVITHTPGYSGGPAPSRTGYEVIWPDFVVTDETDKFYFLFPVQGNRTKSHFLRVETVDTQVPITDSETDSETESEPESE